MATSDLLASIMASALRPQSRVELLRTGELVDCTRSASWVGFTVHAAMSRAAWDEIMGPPIVAPTAQEKADVGKRLHDAWRTASLAVQDYKRRGVVLPHITFLLSTADGMRKVRCRLRAGVEHGRPHLTLDLEQ